MSKDSLNDWSTTAASNTDIAGTNIGVGCPPQDVGVFMRTIMAQIAYAVQGTGGTKPNSWHIANPGTVTTQVVNFGQFAPTLGPNGHTKLPGGLRMQWGRATTDGSGLAVITFPVPFGSTDYSIVESHVVPSAGSGGAITSAIVGGTETAAGVTLQSYISTGGASTSRPLRWIAIGTA